MEVNTLDYFKRESDRELLRKRAEKLALHVSEDTSDQDEDCSARDYVFFRMGADVYGLETSVVKEVMIPEEIVSVPCTPDFHRGVLSVRGHLWAVIDLCVFLGMQEGLESDSPSVVLLSGEDFEFCIAVDEILGVSRVRKQELKPLPKSDDRIYGYCLGVTDDRRTVLDGAAFLQDESLVVNEFVGSIL